MDARYRRALRFLARLVDWERERGLTFTQETIRLDLFRASLGPLGDPQHAYPTVIVAGTKGKGSTSFLLARLLRAHGMRVGLFTSPHLMDIKERIRIDGRPIGREEFAGVIERLEEGLPYFGELGRSRTYFETLTAAAFLHFRDRKVDLAVLEVGLGGRLDATNVADPVLSVITTVSRDHLRALGPSILHIASEKAGVLRAGRPALFGPQTPRVRECLLERAEKITAPVTLHGRDFRHEVHEVSEGGTRFTFDDGREVYRNLSLGLLGGHQATNAAVALAALPLLGVARSERASAAALGKARWPGRGEFLAKDPPVLVDGAHNADSATVLARLMGDLFPGRRCVLLFGGSKGKEFHMIFRRLLPIVAEVILTESEHPRRRPAAELLPIARRQDGRIPIRVIPDGEEALRAALDRQNGRPLLVTGSLYLVGDMKRCWRRLLAERRECVVL
ncbi:MAG: cyanophycin synthetase [Candidatus Eisenbacteria bacterium]